MYLNSKKNTWREFQLELQLDSRRKNHSFVFSKIFIPLLIIFAAGYCLKIAGPFLISKITVTFKSHPFPENSPGAPGKNHNKVTLEELRNLLAAHHIPVNTEKNNFFLNDGGRKLEIHTSLNIPLQKFILSRLQILRTLDRGKPQRIAMVVMEPETGRVLAMAGFDLTRADFNICTDGEFPAASTFKIITASAAIENCGYTPHTPIYFNGGKYTLYKSQLKERKNKYTQKISFANAFAESVNPVFGKIGSRHLGGKILKKYASAFGFNREMDSDFPFKTGLVKIGDSAYQWAEVGCGFNKTTTMTPLFGAMMSSTLLDWGRPTVPCLVDRVTDATGKTIYKREEKTAGRAVNPETAKTLMKMMEKTITMGTAKKSFRKWKRDRILSRLIIGGKTGSISNKDHTVKYDWFTGFAREKHGEKQIALAVLVGHRKYIGIRAAMYGKMIIKEYFNRCFDLRKLSSRQASLTNG